MQEGMKKCIDSFKKSYPDYTDSEIEEIIKLRTEFWKGLIENYYKYFK